MSDGNQFGAPVPGGGSGNYGSSYGGGSGNSGYNGGGYNGGNYNGGYGGGNYGGYGGGNNGQGISVAALVCGILGLITFWAWYIGPILAILGIIFGVKGRKDSPFGKTGLATAGLVLGIVAIVLAIIVIIIAIIGLIALNNAFGSYSWYNYF